MTNKNRQAVIDYLEYGDRFTPVLVKELKRSDLTDYEKRTYSSLLDALTGALELQCSMTEWGDNIDVVVYQNQEKEKQSIAAEIVAADRVSYLQGFSDCMKAVHEGGFKGLEEKVKQISEL